MSASRRLACIASAAALAIWTSTAARAFDMAPAIPLEDPGTTVPILADVPASAEAAPLPGDGLEHLKVKITAVQGLVQVRDGEDQPWRKATVDMELNEEAEFRTGPRSMVQFLIPPDQFVRLDRLGTVKILQAINDNGKLKTNLGMKYGRTNYDIEEAGLPHESSITSPSSTLAVRGTKVSLFDQPPFKPEAVSLTGRAQFRDLRTRPTALGNKGQGKTTIVSGQSSAAHTALAASYIDPSISLARTAAESPLIDALVSRGATVSFDRQAGITVVTGGHPLSDRELIPVLPGQLDFVLRWFGPADLNLGVISPGSRSGEFVYPVSSFNIARSGGRTDFDHRGGPNGGIEIVYWPAGYPIGYYGLGVQSVSGNGTRLTLEAFLNGETLPLTNFTSPPVTLLATDITKGGTVAAFAPVGVPFPPTFNTAATVSAARAQPLAASATATTPQRPAGFGSAIMSQPHHK